MMMPKLLSLQVPLLILLCVSMFHISCIVANSTDNQTTSVSLPIGDLNLVVLTDTHSWIGGHGKNEDSYNADYGHVLSFYERLRAHCYEQNQNSDLWLVMNGDWIDGTGLALDGDPSYLIPLLEKMPWDVVNVRGGDRERCHGICCCKCIKYSTLLYIHVSHGLCFIRNTFYVMYEMCHRLPLFCTYCAIIFTKINLNTNRQEIMSYTKHQ